MLAWHHVGTTATREVISAWLQLLDAWLLCYRGRQGAHRCEVALSGCDVQRSALVKVAGVDGDAGLDVTAQQRHVAVKHARAQVRRRLLGRQIQPDMHSPDIRAPSATELQQSFQDRRLAVLLVAEFFAPAMFPAAL